MPSASHLPGLSLSSSDIERYFPHAVLIILRGRRDYGTQGALNETLADLGEHRCGVFNGIETHHLRTEWAACTLREYVSTRRLHRLVPGSSEGATQEQVAAAWREIAQEREAALSWARSKGVLQEVVQEYRYERRRGSFSGTGHEVAGRVRRYYRSRSSPPRP